MCEYICKSMNLYVKVCCVMALLCGGISKAYITHEHDAMNIIKVKMLLRLPESCYASFQDFVLFCSYGL